MSLVLEPMHWSLSVQSDGAVHRRVHLGTLLTSTVVSHWTGFHVAKSSAMHW
jgi:hypothetical protein